MWLVGTLDHVGRQYVYGRDGVGRVTSVTYPDSSTLGTAYNANGRTTSLTPPGQPAHEFTYEPGGARSDYIPPELGDGTDRQYHDELDVYGNVDRDVAADGSVVEVEYDPITGQADYVNMSDGTQLDLHVPGHRSDR